jgi:type VI secretion system secreted protein Hcp
MPYDMFLKIDGINGDSSDDAHKQWIEVESFSHRISQPVGGALSAQGVHTGGRADHADFSVVKRLDSASPNLALYCCNGRHIPNIRFELCRAMGDKTVFMVYTFKDVIIASVSPSGSADAEDPIPIEEATFRYGQLNWEYTPTDITGGGKKGAAIQAGWSTLLNKAM